jgi:hypothetical protein
MWPIKPLAEEEAVTRDFLLGVTQQRRERFIAFFDDDRREVLAQLIEEEHAEATKHQQPQQVVQAAEAKKEGDDAPASQATKAKGKAKLPLKLFTPYKLVRAHLTRKEFVIEDNINLANIWWLYDRIKYSTRLSLPHAKFVRSTTYFCSSLLFYQGLCRAEEYRPRAAAHLCQPVPQRRVPIVPPPSIAHTVNRDVYMINRQPLSARTINLDTY